MTDCAVILDAISKVVFSQPVATAVVGPVHCAAMATTGKASIRCVTVAVLAVKAPTVVGASRDHELGLSITSTSQVEPGCSWMTSACPIAVMPIAGQDFVSVAPRDVG